MTVPPLRAGDAAFLDFDGTLAGLADDPDAVRLDAGRQAALLRLAGRLGGALCVISGRSLPDLAARLPEGLWRAGGHGMDLAAPGEEPGPEPQSPPELLAAAEAAAAAFPGARVERKGPVLAVHYRAAPEAGPALGAALARAVRTAPGYRRHGGKMVWELKPEGRDKGLGLRRLMLEPPFAGRMPVMLGDDVTDEDAFAAALELGGRAIKVGPGESLAAERLPDVATVWDWLEAGGA